MNGNYYVEYKLYRDANTVKLSEYISAPSLEIAVNRAKFSAEDLTKAFNRTVELVEVAQHFQT